MTKAQLIEFIQSNYTDDEQLVFQIMSQSDVELHTLTNTETWNEFVANEEHYGAISTEYSEMCYTTYDSFAEELLLNREEDEAFDNE